MTDPLREIIRRNRAGEAVAIPSVCTAHPEALTASLMLARDLAWPVLIEATSNQVNQHGGYTGLTADGFRAMVLELCEKADVPSSLVTFGGDHLGPQAWRSRAAPEAMAEAAELVRSYVQAGFRKIHLDCSEGCAGEPAQVGDTVAAERAAELAGICEAAASDPETLVYVVGTEVPPPGGGRGEDQAIVPTSVEAALATLEAHRDAFARRGLDAAFARVVGLVVQPGLDFEPEHVHALPPDGAMALRAVLDAKPGLCLEAHSTDYQAPETYRALARAGFAIQKVGPALTHAYRWAVYALAELEASLTGRRGTPDIALTMERIMLETPRWWSGHYHGTPED
ncbi:MAG: class II D-tagatose-bisphosphate aldolase, non-catalytic subunit, partial [Proteobacteria bacterium]|nr:class II D-tagatose-bisphosphate aldolase, non-catalytic subunit [Pseudomonadota bacterium]